MRIAVIDLGTNTFNLLIVEADENLGYQIVYNSKLPVKLGKSGMDKKEIRPDAITRGLNAIERHLHTIHESGVERVFAVATSGIRSARNGEQFVKMIQQRFNLDVEVISGDREAELIYHGVKQAVQLSQEKVLILDIGGGSIEFIIADRSNIYWKKSYPLGVARLLAKFKPSDPVSIEEIEFISNYLEERLADLFEEFRKHKINTLVGASGSFETIAAMIRADEEFETETGIIPQSVNIDLTDFENLYQKLINSTLKERKQMKGLESMRLEMIVIATLIVKFILQKLKLNHMIQSNFSLKEGMVYEVLNMKTVTL